LESWENNSDWWGGKAIGKTGFTRPNARYSPNAGKKGKENEAGRLPRKKKKEKGKHTTERGKRDDWQKMRADKRNKAKTNHEEVKQYGRHDKRVR